MLHLFYVTREINTFNQSNSVLNDHTVIGYVENHKFNAAPVAPLASRYRDQFVECPAPHPQFAIQSDVRHLCLEPLWSIEKLSLATDELFTIPNAAKPVKLL